MRRKRFKSKVRKSGEMTLQITSMADIFTVLLVFLLKSFATGSMNITPPKGLILPEAQASLANIEAIKVEILKDAVMVDDKLAVELAEFRFPGADNGKNGTSKTLLKSFNQARKRQIYIAKMNSSVKVDPKIVVVADQNTPYEVIKRVLASAAVNGYVDFKLAVVKKGS
jgi:biopolymer transport protein ExbD